MYSYDWLENLVGSDLHNADRIHSEWQHLAVGDPVRFIPERFLGRFDTGQLAWRVATIDPNRALVLKGAYALILQPIDVHTTRLIARMRSGSALEASEPFNFIMARRMLLGIKERAEGAIRPRALDIAEVVSWMIAFGVSVVAGLGVLVRKEWQWSLAVLVGAIATFLALLFARPPLWAGGLLDLALVAAPAWTYRPRPGIARA